MRNLIYLLLIAFLAVIAACSKSMSYYDNELDNAENLMSDNADSALVILEAIEPSDIKSDSLLAKYHYLKAYSHMKCHRSMTGDSLVAFSYSFYRGRDVVRDIRSGNAFAWYKFWVGDTPGAIAMLDSLAALKNVPDSIMVQTLRTRVLLGNVEYQGQQLIPFAKRLIELESDSLRKIEAGYMLVSAYEYAGETDSALYIIEGLIDYVRSHKLGEKHFLYELELAQLLSEAGCSEESNRVVDDIFAKAGPGNGAADFLHLQYAINALNSGDISRASHYLVLADSLAVSLNGNDALYFRGYSNLIHTIIDFKRSGRITLTHISGLYNRQSERFNRMKASQLEAEQGALQQKNRALTLKAESRHKTVIILIIIIAALLMATGAVWIIVTRRRHEREKEERIEALQKMVDEYKSSPAAQEAEIKDSSALRGVMLKQLGIIKMVAETPTEQNREMLRKISSIDGDTNGELVDWVKVFELIDSLYPGFYSNLHNRYGDILTLREEQIIVLMVARFSTKEISVITGQTISTIYVRKTSIRKKLGVPEKEDIVAFLRNKTDS